MLSFYVLTESAAVSKDINIKSFIILWNFSKYDSDEQQVGLPNDPQLLEAENHTSSMFLHVYDKLPIRSSDVFTVYLFVPAGWRTAAVR